MAVFCHSRFFLAEIKGSSCKAYKSPLPNPAFSKKMGFMGTPSRAATTLTPQIPVFPGSDAPSSQGRWGEGSEMPGLTKPQASTGHPPRGTRLPPPLPSSCSLVNSFYFKPLAGVALPAAVGTQPALSATGGAGKPRRRQLPVYTGLWQRVRRKPNQDSSTQRRWPRRSCHSRETSPQKRLGHKPGIP